MADTLAPGPLTRARNGSDSFDPSSVESFRNISRTFHPMTGAVVFTYGLDDLAFEEHYVFPMPAGAVPALRMQAFERLIDHLFLVAGLSYFKMAVPPTIRIETGTWSPADIADHAEILAGGLGEFCYENNLAPRLCPRYEYEMAEKPPVLGSVLDHGPLVPVGGGKDSCVTVEALRFAGFTPTQVTVRRYPVIQRVIDASGLPDLAVERTLDPRIGEMNRRGALNGHVPATAIVSFAALCVAALHGFDAVVMSNERSASEGNVVYQGVEINHQWSKSHEAEQLLSGIVQRSVEGLAYFSLLRPLSELAIARRFATTCTRYYNHFASCNENFRIDPARRGAQRWCRRCPKCQFVFLALGTAINRLELERIFGGDVFSESPVEGFAALLGLQTTKPFECVGEVDECRAAWRMIVDSHQWDGHQVVELVQRTLQEVGAWPGDDLIAGVLATEDRSLLDQESLGIATKYREVLFAHR